MDSSKLKAYFRSFDKNNDGTISKKELRKVFSDWSTRDCDDLFSKIDQNRDNRISYDEFVDWVMSDKALPGLNDTPPHPTSPKESVTYNPLADGAGRNVDSDAQTMFGIEVKERFRDMKSAFLKLDENHDGKITKKELLGMCKKWNIPTAEAERVLNVADLDHNGSLSFHEFALRFDPLDPSEAGVLPISPNISPSAPRRVDDRPIKPSGWGWGDEGGGYWRDDRGRDERSAKASKGDDRGHEERLAKATKCDQCAWLKARVAELEDELARRERVHKEELERILAQYRPAAAVRGAGKTEIGDQREKSEEDEDDPTTVFVYGRHGCDKTEQMHKALRNAKISFKKRNFDNDKRYSRPLRQAGGEASAQPPIVIYGSRVWWDNPNTARDEMFKMPFSAVVASDLRHDLGILSAPQQTVLVPVRTDADMDTEIAERFSSMQEAFLKVDSDRDGRITKMELIQRCREWNIPTSEAERIIGEADIDRNGTLDFNEFAIRFNSALPMKIK